MNTPTEQLFHQIQAIDLTKVPVMSLDRSIRRKDQAKLARELFKKFGLKGLSVTAPNYSMAMVVDVRVPTLPREESDYIGPDGVDYQHHCFSDMPMETPVRAKHMAHYAAIRKIDAILLKAFPKHDDRSDSQSDHFDSCWSVN